MPVFGLESRTKLATVHPDLQTLFNEVIKYWDCKVTDGRRTTAEQVALYAKGRTQPGPIVTDKDGIHSLSNHQLTALVKGKNYGLAVDVAPYPIQWNDTERFYAFAGFVLGVAKMKGINIRWGGDWDSDRDLHDQKLYDLPHFEIVL